MGQFGAKDVMFAPMTAGGVEGEKFPTYGEAVDLGPLVVATPTYTYASGRNYGSDELQDCVDEFQEVALALSVTELPILSAAVVFGSKQTASGGIGYNLADAAPEGMVAYHIKKQIKKNGVRSIVYQGVCYPRLKAVRQGVAHNTKTNSITFANSAMNFIGGAEENGFYEVFSDNLATEAEAKAWVALMLRGGAEALAEANASAAG